MKNVNMNEEEEDRYDGVDHPKHYCTHPSKVQCIEIAEHFDFCLGNVIKYVWRAGQKEGAEGVDDLRKAMWYLHREIANRAPGGWVK